MQKILIATGNPGKFGEMMEVLGDLPCEFVFLKELDVDSSDFVEDGETFADNSRKKAKYFGDKLGMWAIGEDSGILIDAFPGELGVKTRRWGAGEHASDEEWIEYFFSRMDGEKNRGGKFVCNSCFYDGEEFVNFEGEASGVITEGVEAQITPGIPLSACFKPEGMDKVYSLLSEREKNAISHRGKAMKALKVFLGKKLADE